MSFYKPIYTKIHEKLEQVKGTLVGGGIKTLEDYKYYVGMFTAFNATLDILKEQDKKDSKEDADD